MRCVAEQSDARAPALEMRRPRRPAAAARFALALSFALALALASLTSYASHASHASHALGLGRDSHSQRLPVVGRVARDVLGPCVAE